MSADDRTTPAEAGQRANRRGKWGIVSGAVLAALLLAGFLLVRSAWFQTWWTLRRVRQPGNITALERWLRGRDLISQLNVDEARDLLVGLDSPAASPLLRAVEDKDPNLQTVAQFTLWKLGRRAVPGLIEALQDEQPRVRRRAALRLSQIRPPPTDAAPALVHALSDADWGVRETATIALGEIGPAAKDAVSALTRALEDEEWPVRAAAAHALAAIGSAAREAVPALARRLEDEQWPVRAAAAASLGKIGPAAKATVPALKKLAASDEDRGVRRAAAEALKMVQTEQDAP